MCKKTDELQCHRVSEETIAETTKCEKDFSCLQGQHDDLCPIDYCVNGKVHFIKCLNGQGCSYQGSFGNGLLCHCPVRKELYNKHGV